MFRSLFRFLFPSYWQMRQELKASRQGFEIAMMKLGLHEAQNRKLREELRVKNDEEARIRAYISHFTTISWSGYFHVPGEYIEAGSLLRLVEYLAEQWRRTALDLEQRNRDVANLQADRMSKG